MRRNRPFAAVFAALLAAPAFAADQAAFDQALSEAKSALKAGASVGGEWRDSGKLLKKAEDAAAKGDYAKAITLAETAKFQGIRGEAQAKAEQNVGNPSYLQN